MGRTKMNPEDLARNKAEKRHQYYMKHAQKKVNISDQVSRMCKKIPDAKARKAEIILEVIQYLDQIVS